MIKKHIDRHIEKVRGKSYAEKSNLAFLISLGITSVIATIWFLTIFANPTQYFESPDADKQALANTGSLFDVFKEGIK